MRTKKELTALFLGIFFALTASADDFQKAIEAAKKAELTEVAPARAGVPYYAKKTLDPVWSEKDRAIVRIDKLALTDQKNLLRTENLFDGKVTFVTFLFTSCAGFCPTLVRNLQDVEKAVTDAGKTVQFVAISVDPEKDTPAQLEAYGKKMKVSDRWHFLTGDEAAIYGLAHDTFAAEAFKLPRSKGQVAHSEHFYVLDEQRRLRGVLKGTRRDVPEKARELLVGL